MINCKWKRLHEKAVLPTYATEYSAGMDVYCLSELRMVPGMVEQVPLGFAIEIPQGYEMQIRSRSGLAKRGVTVMNQPGTIDADYRGEVCVLLTCKYALDIPAGTRIAQLVLKEVPQVMWELTDSLKETTRGAGGFGSTGDV